MNDQRASDRMQARSQISIDREELKQKNLVEKETQRIRLIEVQTQLASYKAQKGEERR